MNKKEYCKNNPVCAVYSMGYTGLEIHGIEYGIDDYVIYKYVISENKATYHCSKIYYTVSGKAYFVWNNRRIPLNECIRTNTVWCK